MGCFSEYAIVSLSLLQRFFKIYASTHLKEQFVSEGQNFSLKHKKTILKCHYFKILLSHPHAPAARV